MAITKSELERLPQAGPTAPCPHCGKILPIQFADTMVDGNWVPSKMLGFVKCANNSFLASIHGRLLA